MTDYTVDEVQTAINEATDGRYGFDWNYHDVLNLRGDNVDIEWVDSTGGEGEGSNASSVFKIGDQLFRKLGYYASHYGYDWDGDLDEVEAYDKTVTDYRSV